MPEREERKREEKTAKEAAKASKRPTGRDAPHEEEGGRLSGRDLRGQLLRKKDEILRETHEEIKKYIKGENRQLVESALDNGDWSVIDLAEDINLRRLGTHRETLLKIDEALRKLDEKTYGICEDCEEEINAERLGIMPFAIRCRDCQEEREEMEAAEKEGS